MKVEEIFTEEGMTTIANFPTEPFVRPKKKRKKKKKDDERSEDVSRKTSIES